MLSSVNKENKFINIFFIFFICLVPCSLPFSIFLSDFSLVISSTTFLFLLRRDDFKRFFLNKFTFLFFSWYLYLLSTSLLSSNILHSLESSLFYFRFYIYSLSIWYCLVKYNYFLKYYFFSLTFIFIFILCDSYIQLVTGFNLIGYEYNNQWNRLTGFFNDEYILGSYVSRILPIIIALFFQYKILINNKFFISLILILLSSIIILFSGERTALLNLLIFFFLFIFLADISIKKIFIYFIVFVVFIFVFLGFNNDIKNRMVNFSLDQLFEGTSLNIFSVQHQLIYETAYKIYKDNKIIGIGPKNFRVVCKNYKSKSSLDKSEDGCSTSPHNIYIQLLAETGIIGFSFIFFLFLYISVIIFKMIFKNLFSPSYGHTSLKLLLIPCFISLWPIIPTGNFFNNWMNIIYFTPIGFLMFNINDKQND